MNKAMIVGSSGKPLEQVLDPTNTLRCVRRPDVQPCWLNVWTDVESTLVVEVDGDSVGTHKLPARTQTKIALNMLVNTSARNKVLRILTQPLSLMGKTKGSRAAEPTDFTIFIRRGGEDGALIGTYGFRLMSEKAFDEAFGTYVRNTEAPPEPAHYTTDERSLETENDCWNCHKPLKGGQCCQVCGCQQKDDNEEDSSK